MPGNFRKDDLRIIKTRKFLIDALKNLLKRRGFAKITVNDLCEEAQLSRATFYAHFKDKYDLLEYWFDGLSSYISLQKNNYEFLEATINKVIYENKKIVSHLFKDADNEVYGLMNKFMISVSGLPVPDAKSGKYEDSYIIMTTFCAGGMVNYLAWLDENKFPPELPPMNKHVYGILTRLICAELHKDRDKDKEENEKNGD